MPRHIKLRRRWQHFKKAASSYLPIAEHGIVGDPRSAGAGGHRWDDRLYCPERFDGPRVFGALLDRARGGFYRIAPTYPTAITKQLYLPDTNILITRFMSRHGVSETQDSMRVYDQPQRLIRRRAGVRRTVRFRLEMGPRFDYGRRHPRVTSERGGASFHGAGQAVAIAAPVALAPSRTGVPAEFELIGAATALDRALQTRRPPAS